MTRKKPDIEPPAVREAKGAVQAAIGKLIGDDAAVEDGRKSQGDDKPFRTDRARP